MGPSILKTAVLTLVLVVFCMFSFVSGKDGVRLISSTTSSSVNCPENSECQSCPAFWKIPTLQEITTPTGDDTCDVQLIWDTDVAATDGGPVVSFTCVYGETGEYCNANANLACASCGTVTLTNITASLQPYVSYTDNCGLSGQSIIAQDCYRPPESTTAHNTTCPISLKCSGCDTETWFLPQFTATGGPKVNGTCDFDITWNWVHEIGEEYINPRFTFQCIYSSGEFCDGDHFKSRCGSCETVTFKNLREEEQPYINFSDTCGDLARLDGLMCGTTTTLQLI